MQEFIASLVAVLIIQPLESEMEKQFSDMRGAEQRVAEATECLRNEIPNVVDRAQNDLGWTVMTGVELWIGTSDPGTVLAEVAPRCASLNA